MMKKIWLMVCILIGCSVVVLLLLELPEKKERKQAVFHKPVDLPTEQFIRKHLFHEDGTIRTNFEGRAGSELALSESLGLWMEYLLEKQDHELFEEVYETLVKSFWFDEGLVAWKIENGILADTNALIDDLRIMKALYVEGEKIGRNDYIQTATKIARSLAVYNRNGEHFVDFYDVKHQLANDEITLSYLDMESVRYMVKYDVISERTFQFLETFLHTIKLDNGFYPKSYNVRMKSFEFENPVNLIDQLYTAFHFEKAGVKADEFYEWLKAEFYKNHSLFGRYDRITKNHAVEYESASVYALTILYSLERGDISFAKDVYQRMITMRINDEQSDFYGGYVTSNETHSFDNLLPLLAERIFIHETSD